MADAYRKISDFSKTTAFNDTDLLLISQNGSTKVVEGSKVKSYVTDAAKEAAKITKAEINADGNLVLTLADGTTSFDCGEVVGTSITGASIDSNYHLILTLSNGNTLDAGYCRGEQGESNADMLKSVYDPDNTIADAGGIPSYVGTSEQVTTTLTTGNATYFNGSAYSAIQYYSSATKIITGMIYWLPSKIRTTGSLSSLTFTMTNHKKAPTYFGHLVCAGLIVVGTGYYPCVIEFENLNTTSATVKVRRTDGQSINITSTSDTVKFYANYSYVAAS